MDRIVVYGLGKRFRDYKKYIEKNYRVIGCCDADASKKERGYRSISVSELGNMINDCDYILITPAGGNAVEIREYLNEMGIPPAKTRFLSDQIPYKNCWLYADERLISPHAEHYEDLVVDVLREKIGIPYDEFFYIDGGVNDPIINNNTYYFYERGAKGFLVEANIDIISIIEEARPKDIVLNRAIYEEKVEKIDFFISKASQLSSVFKNHIKKEKCDQATVKKQVSIETIRINDLLKRARDEKKECNYLSLDIEGYDYIVIEHIDFSLYRPVVIMVEMIQDENEIEGRRIIEHLNRMDYYLVYNSECNGIFLDKKYISIIK